MNPHPATIVVADLRCYVVNLARRPDRRAQIAAQLPDELAVAYTSDWDGPFDGRDLAVDRLDHTDCQLWPWRTDSDNPGGTGR